MSLMLRRCRAATSLDPSAPPLRALEFFPEGAYHELSNFHRVGMVVMIDGFNSMYNKKEAKILQYNVEEKKFLVHMTNPPTDTDGNLWVDPSCVFLKQA